MIVKDTLSKLTTEHTLGEMYITLNEKCEKTQKFLRSAENLNDAIRRATELNQECIKFGLGCVVAEMKKSGGQRQLVKTKNGRSYVKKRAYKKATTEWLVYLAEDGNAYNVDENHIIGSLYNREP